MWSLQNRAINQNKRRKEDCKNLAASRSISNISITMKEKVDFLFDAYNKMHAKKQELERQINCLVKLLNAINCPASVINKALNEET